MLRPIKMHNHVKTTNEIVQFYLTPDPVTGTRHADYMCPARMCEILRYCHQHPATSEQAKNRITTYLSAQMVKLQEHENQ